jgi:hypothetical protein
VVIAAPLRSRFRNWLISRNRERQRAAISDFCHGRWVCWNAWRSAWRGPSAPPAAFVRAAWSQPTPWIPAAPQYHSTAILQRLERAADPNVRVLGVTSLDLFVPVLTFVFGEAQLDGACALVSRVSRFPRG